VECKREKVKEKKLKERKIKKENPSKERKSLSYFSVLLFFSRKQISINRKITIVMLHSQL